MLQRATEIVFKHKLLILLPLVIVVAISVGATLRPTRPEWRSTSTVWVDQDKPLYQDDRLGYAAATGQAQLLNDFIHTHSFIRSVLEQTPLAPAAGDIRNQEKLEQAFWRAVQVVPMSTNFLTITVTTPDREVTYALARAINGTFQDILQKRLEEQSAIADRLYGEALTRAQKTLDATQTQLATYLATHPNIALGGNDSGLPLTIRDRDFGALVEQVTLDQESYNSARRDYMTAQQKAAASRDAQPFTFSVVDQPQRPIAPVKPKVLDLVKLPVIGLLLGLMLSAGVATLLIYTDHTIRNPQDIEVALGTPVLSVITDLGRSKWAIGRRKADDLRLQVATPARRYR